MRLKLAICRAATREQVTLLWVLDVALIRVDGELVIKPEDFGLSQYDLSLLFLLQFSELKHSSKSLNLDIFGWLSWWVLVQMRLKGAVFLLCVLLLATFLCNFRLLCLELILEVLRVVLVVLGGILGRLRLEVFLTGKVYLGFESVLLSLSLLVLLSELLLTFDTFVVLRPLNDRNVRCDPR